MAKMMLYNGVELPGLMDDTTNYPIQHIYVDSTTGTYMLIAAPKDGATVNPGSDNQHKELPAGRILYSLDSENLLWVERDRTTSVAYLYIRDMAGGKPIWSLSGFYFDSEYLVYPSDPVPVPVSPEIPNMTRDRAFLLGNLLRQGLVARREPVAYLYNGVRLPKLPSVSGYDFKILWDRRNAPLSNVTLYLCATPPTTVDGDGNITVNQNGDGCIKYKFNINYSTDWSDGVVLNDIDILPGFAGNGELLNTKWLWSNCNIYDADGNVVHAATDPIPVYE